VRGILSYKIPTIVSFARQCEDRDGKIDKLELAEQRQTHRNEYSQWFSADACGSIRRLRWSRLPGDPRNGVPKTSGVKGGAWPLRRD
jgi:hypothetical protein